MIQIHVYLNTPLSNLAYQTRCLNHFPPLPESKRAWRSFKWLFGLQPTQNSTLDRSLEISYSYSYANRSHDMCDSGSTSMRYEICDVQQKVGTKPDIHNHSIHSFGSVGPTQLTKGLVSSPIIASAIWKLEFYNIGVIFSGDEECTAWSRSPSKRGKHVTMFSRLRSSRWTL